jgi:sulfur carrier protein
MQLRVNGALQEMPQESLSIADLLVHLSLNGPVAVELNRAIVPKRKHTETVLADGDILEIVHFVGGG